MAGLVHRPSPIGLQAQACGNHVENVGVSLNLISPRSIKKELAQAAVEGNRDEERVGSEAGSGVVDVAVVEGVVEGVSERDDNALSQFEMLEEKLRKLFAEVREETDAEKTVLDTIVCCAEYALRDKPLLQETKARLVEERGIEVLIKMMRKGIDDRQIQLTCHKLVQMLSSNNAAVQEAIGATQGIQTIIHVMLKYKEDVELLNGAMNALLYLTPCIQNRKLIGNFFGIEVTISSMKTFQDECSVQERGCALLANAAFQNRPNKQVIVGIGGIKAILRAMKKCKDTSLVSFWGCLALRNISFNYEDAMTKIGMQAGIKAILIALVTFKEDDDIQEQGCAALRNITQDHAPNQMTLVDMRGLEVVVRCMKRFRTLYSVHENCVAMMKSIIMQGDDTSVAEKIAGAGATEAILSSMIQYRSDCGFQMDCVVVLDRLARTSDDIRERIVAAEGVETINGTLRVHLMELDLVEQGVALQRYLRARTAQARKNSSASKER